LFDDEEQLRERQIDIWYNTDLINSRDTKIIRFKTTHVYGMVTFYRKNTTV